MSPHPILLIGGSGIVGRWTARLLRAAHSAAPLLIGGRDLSRARAAAAEVGAAEGVVIDLSEEAAERLGFIREGRTRVRLEVLTVQRHVPDTLRMHALDDTTTADGQVSA